MEHTFAASVPEFSFVLTTIWDSDISHYSRAPRQKLVKEYNDLFNFGSHLLVQILHVCHFINTGSSTALEFQTNRTSAAECRIIKHHVSDMLKQENLQ